MTALTPSSAQVSGDLASFETMASQALIDAARPAVYREKFFVIRNAFSAAHTIDY